MRNLKEKMPTLEIISLSILCPYFSSLLNVHMITMYLMKYLTHPVCYLILDLPVT